MSKKLTLSNVQRTYLIKLHDLLITSVSQTDDVKTLLLYLKMIVRNNKYTSNDKILLNIFGSYTRKANQSDSQSNLEHCTGIVNMFIKYTKIL